MKRKSKVIKEILILENEFKKKLDMLVQMGNKKDR